MSARKGIVLAGGSGFLGQALAKHFQALGWEIVVLTRQGRAAEEGVRFAEWDGASTGPWAAVAAVLGWDFIYYWNHRFMHETRWLWAIHVVHHSSEHYNLSTALRQPTACA